MSNSTSGLGRGLDSLIPKGFDSSLIDGADSGKIVRVSVDDLMANPEQPRLVFNEDELSGLATSIKRYGILQPLVITPTGNKYYIIAGARRWRAAKIAKVKSLPAIIRTSEQLERLELALVENVQRVNLSPLEQAVSIRFLNEQFSLDFKTIGERLGKAATTVQNISRLLNLPEEVQQALRDKQITEGHARSILSLKETKQQLKLLKLILLHGWSVRQVERYVVALRDGDKTVSSAKSKVATKTSQTESLSKILSTPVSVRRMAKGGKLEISFKTDEDLSRIMEIISQST